MVRWVHPVTDPPLLKVDTSAEELSPAALSPARLDDRRPSAGPCEFDNQRMRLGGRRKLRISPHLAYAEAGVQPRVPPNAVIVAEIEFIEERLLFEEEHR